VTYVVLGIALTVIAAAAWLWWTGARRDRGVAPTNVEEAGFESLGSAIVVLRDNFWDECVIDGIGEDWRRFSAGGARGFYAVPPGRHRAVTRCARGTAELDFVLYPNEVYVRRLDHGAATWLPEDSDTAEKYRALARGGAMSGALISYKVVVGIARVMRGDAILVPDTAYEKARARLEDLLERAREVDLKTGSSQLVEEADAAGRALVGVPLSGKQLESLTRAVGEAVRAQGSAGGFLRGALMASIGLAILPDDPYLLEQLARMLCDGGVADEAELAIQKALERSGALDDDTSARARATKAEVLVRLGRADEARAIVDALVAARPGDANAVRVKVLVYEKITN
jgi:tetratricopeptide (TPR) repeat protein